MRRLYFEDLVNHEKPSTREEKRIEKALLFELSGTRYMIDIFEVERVVYGQEKEIKGKEGFLELNGEEIPYISYKKERKNSYALLLSSGEQKLLLYVDNIYQIVDFPDRVKWN